MLRNYLTVAIRNLLRQKVYSFINVFGLAIGIAFCILTFMYLRNELTFDTFHKQATQIYRIHEIVRSPASGERYFARAPNPLAAALKNDYPDLVAVGLSDRESWITIGEKSFKENVFFAEPDFFEVFSFPFEKGAPGTALSHMHSIVLTEDMAQKYFENEDPMGKVLTLDNQYDLVVTGILQRIPENSSIDFGLLVPSSLRSQIDPEFAQRWWEAGTYTYIRCSETFTGSQLEAQLPYIYEKYIPDFMKDRVRLAIQPLTDIHLDGRTTGEMVPGNSPVYLHILIAITLSVLLIACFNFTNLSTARYTERTREIGVRKVLGAQRLQLIKQFLGEAVFLSVLGLFLGMVLVELALPAFNNLVDRELAIDYQENILMLPSILGFGLLVGILAGSYPAFFLSAYHPVEAIREQKATSRGNAGLRRILVVLQFAISSLLIVCELVIVEQVRFMKNQDLGFDPDHVIAVPTGTFDMPDDQFPRIGAYVQAIQTGKEQAGIVSCSVSENVPGSYFHNRFGIVPEGLTREESMEMIVTSIDERFLDTYEIPLAEGRNFSPEFGTDRSQAVLLNETAVNKMGWPSAVGKEIKYVHGGGPLQVIGVVADIHFKSLREKIEPLVFRYADGKYESRHISVRVRPGYTQAALRFLGEKWQEIMPDSPFEYTFVEDGFDESYQSEEHTTRIIGSFSFLSIFLSCFGLFGLAALSVRQRTKEIGIRKVLGASVSNIVLLLSKEICWLVVMANVIVWPVAYFVMQRWLQEFPYRIDMTPGIFALGGIAALLIAWLTVSYQAIKTALANPVDALRYE